MSAPIHGRSGVSNWISTSSPTVSWIVVLPVLVVPLV
jgi:hypothetical protein